MNKYQSSRAEISRENLLQSFQNIYTVGNVEIAAFNTSMPRVLAICHLSAGQLTTYLEATVCHYVTTL